ncbi:MAG: hypothetical protein LBR13_03885 [Dysgonamonadaceae bacterium]|jgi:hypothetical protein|nr:hypothetical protein [Dysgonamonadaceae bacterium]
MTKQLFFLLLILGLSCKSVDNQRFIPNKDAGANAFSLADFIEKSTNADLVLREKLIKNAILSGNFPDFLLETVEIKTSAIIDGEHISASYFVMPDYLSVGHNDNFLRIPMQPSTAQQIADSLGFFLSTPKICDDIYRAATIKLEPHPLTTARDSFPTFVLHNEIIEKQRNKKKGLIAGIKKDVVITGALLRNPKSDRVAIYGWHKIDGTPIQPVYTGHVNWYVDYSHGIRLVDKNVIISGKSMDYRDVLADDKLYRLLTYESDRGFSAYPTK